MTAPTQFAAQLQREFDGRYRLRWSAKRQEWHLEQKVGHGAIDVPIDDVAHVDDVIRARDGYALVMQVREGDRMPCPRCGHELHVPVMETAEVTCVACRANGVDGRYAAAYFPLGDALIQHIRHIDAFLGHREDIKDFQDAENQRLLDDIRRASLNEIDAISLDIRKTFGGIEQVGYGGSIIRPAGGDF